MIGYPISARRIETVEEHWTGPVQWFERDRLEDHSNERKGVLAGRLGARARAPGDQLAGTDFPEEDLRAMGVPQELWPYGASVRGPTS